jgi:hypothetical protein
VVCQSIANNARAVWLVSRATTERDRPAAVEGAAGRSAPSAAEIRAWLVAQIAAQLRIDPPG